jgi:hypothetical protein
VPRKAAEAVALSGPGAATLVFDFPKVSRSHDYRSGALSYSAEIHWIARRILIKPDQASNPVARSLE